MTPPESSGSSASRGWILPLLAVIVLVGAVMYFLGRRAPSAPPGTGQTARATLDAAGGPGTAAADAPARPAGRRFAPHDTFYLLQYVSTKTPTGVIGFEPGREVHLVEAHQPTQTLVVGDGEAQVEVGPDKLTNDLDIADLVRQKDQASQAKIAAYLQAEQQAYNDAQRAAADKFEKAADKLNQAQQQQAAKVAAANNNHRPNATPSGSPGNAADNSPVGSTGTKLDEPAVPVGGTSGYGYAGSAYYGSPYSYFNGSSAGVAAPTGGTGSRGANPATVGTAR